MLLEYVLLPKKMYLLSVHSLLLWESIQKTQCYLKENPKYFANDNEQT